MYNRIRNFAKNTVEVVLWATSELYKNKLDFLPGYFYYTTRKRGYGVGDGIVAEGVRLIIPVISAGAILPLSDTEVLSKFKEAG